MLNLPVKTRLQILSMVQHLFVSPSLLPPRVVAFCAAAEDSGARSWLCAHASDTLAAAAGGSVCAVDADFHSASLHAYFGMPNGAGFAELLHDRQTPATERCLHASGRLWLLTAGSCPERGTEALAANAAQGRLAELRTRFQHVFISAPPVADDGAAAVLGRSTDGVVLVLRANKTRRTDARRVKEEFQALGVPVLAAIMLDPGFGPDGAVSVLTKGSG